MAEQIFTEREVQCYLAGLRDARDIAQLGKKGLTASRRIQEFLTQNTLRFERCQLKGVFNA
jgi:hypothetical protein